MINEIMEAMADSLNEIFPESKIYNEQIKSKIDTPCLFISLKSFKEDKMISNRYFNKVSFQITYHAKNQMNKNDEFFSVYEKIKDALEILRFNENVYNGKDISFEIKEGILHFYVTYSYFILKIREDEEEQDEKMYYLKNIQKV